MREGHVLTFPEYFNREKIRHIVVHTYKTFLGLAHGCGRVMSLGGCQGSRDVNRGSTCGFSLKNGIAKQLIT